MKNGAYKKFKWPPVQLKRTPLGKGKNLEMLISDALEWINSVLASGRRPHGYCCQSQLAGDCWEMQPYRRYSSCCNGWLYDSVNHIATSDVPTSFWSMRLIPSDFL